MKIIKNIANPGFSFFIKLIAIIVLFSVNIFGTPSCKYFSKENPNHDLYLDSVVNIAEKIKDNHRAFLYIDSSFSALINPGFKDQFKVLYFKQRKYLKFSIENNNQASLIKASKYADSMMVLVETSEAQEKHFEEYAQAYLSKGDVLLKMKKYYESYENYYKGKTIILANINKKSISNYNYRLADVCYLSGKYRQAASLYLEACNEKANQEDNFTALVNTQQYLDNAGLSFAKAGMLDSAIYCYKKALQFIENKRIGYPQNKRYLNSAKGVVYNNLADVVMERFDYKNAEIYLKESIRLNSVPLSENRDGQLAQIRLGNLYLKIGELEEVKSLIRDIKVNIDSLPYDLAELRLKKLELEYFALTKDSANVNKLKPMYLKLRDKMFYSQLDINNTNILNNFYSLQQEYKLNALKKKNDDNFLFLIVAVIFFIMTTTILYQTWKSWKGSKKNNDHLKMLNEQIMEQNYNLVQTLSALEHSEEEHKRLMKIVAHDLRSPIGAIVSLARLLVDDDNLNDDEKHLIGLIHDSGMDSLKFVNELLNKESYNTDFIKEPLELDTLLTYCVNLLQLKADEKKQCIKLKSEAVVFNFNRDRIWRVISNLISNAVKFSPNGKKISVQSEVCGDYIIISVKDQGIGIPEDIQADIFNFSKLGKRTGTDGEKSFGMGLGISKQIVEAHGGQLWFESSASAGTTFFIKLPKI